MSPNRELERCYERARQHLGDGAEPFSVVEAGEKHRQFWRPTDVRVLLLAESHVYTKADECVHMKGAARFDLEGVPENFIRLVYCLGYGESSYVGAPIAGNMGTWQYWLIFSSCINSQGTLPFKSVLKRNSPNSEDRLRTKIQLLKRLKTMGVWLVDSSVLALYTPGGGKPPLRIRERILQTCWDEYIGQVVSGANPRRIIVIGQDVARALESRLIEVTNGEHKTINQPQGLRSSDAIAEAYRSYRSVCQEYCEHLDADA